MCATTVSQPTCSDKHARQPEFVFHSFKKHDLVLLWPRGNQACFCGVKFESCEIIKHRHSHVTSVLKFLASSETVQILRAWPDLVVPVLVCTAHALTLAVFLAVIVNDWLHALELVCRPFCLSAVHGC